MNKLLMTGALALMTLAQPALATTPAAPSPTIIFTPGVTGVPTWTTAKVFEDFDNGSTISKTSYLYKPASNEKVSGDVYLDTYGSNKYLEIASGGSFQVDLSAAEQVFSVILSSFGATDTITLTFANNTTRTLTGGQVFGQSISDPVTSTTRVNFDIGGKSGITSVLFKAGSNCDSFFLDGIAAAAPEPGTWGMMIMGFGAVGAVLRRRRAPRLAIA